MFKTKSNALFTIGMILLGAVFLFIFFYVKDAKGISEIGKLVSGNNTDDPQKIGMLTVFASVLFISSLGGIFLTRGMSTSVYFLMPAAAVAAGLLFWLCKYNVNDPVNSAVPLALFAIGAYALASLWELFVLMQREGNAGFLIMGFVGLVLFAGGAFIFYRHIDTYGGNVVRFDSFIGILPLVLVLFGALYLLVGWIKGIIVTTAFFLLYTVGLIIAIVNPKLFKIIREALKLFSKKKNTQKAE